MMKKVEYKDLYNFRFLNGIKLSPNGKRAVFTEYICDEKTDSYLSYLWVLTLRGAKLLKLTNSGSDKFLRWLDDETILFTTKRTAEKGKTVVMQIRIDGGEAQVWKTVDIPGAGRWTDLAGGKLLLNAATVVGQKKETDPNRAQEGRDLYVFDEIQFWSDGQGITNKKRNQLHVLEKDGSHRRISPEYMNVQSIAQSPDGRTVAYSGLEYTDVRPRTACIDLYDVKSGETKRIQCNEDGLNAGNLQFLDNRHLFFEATPYRFPGQNADAWIYDLQTGERKKLPFYDFQFGGGISGDATYGGGTKTMVCDQKLYTTRVNRTNGQLFAMDKKGEWEQVTRRDGSILCFDIHGNDLVQITMHGDKLAEVYLQRLDTGAERQLTHFNDQWSAEHAVQRPHHFLWKTRDGLEMDGWCIQPVGYEKGKKYPAVYAMHGGPKVAYGSVFVHEMQCFASQGYFVFFTNPRGADGRGQDFANIAGQLGYTDYEDFMDYYHVVIKKYRDIDEKRVAICGGSYAGYMCNWMVGHTNVFAAAASQRSISNYTTKALCTDIGYDHNMSQLLTDPWHDFATVWEHSPLKHAPNATTPTLFIQSDNDYRCWMSDAVQMYNALQQNGTPTKLCLFHGESHGLSRIGRPSNRIGRLTEIGDWFKKYLKPGK